MSGRKIQVSNSPGGLIIKIADTHCRKPWSFELEDGETFTVALPEGSEIKIVQSTKAKAAP